MTPDQQNLMRDLHGFGLINDRSLLDAFGVPQSLLGGNQNPFTNVARQQASTAECTLQGLADAMRGIRVYQSPYWPAAMVAPMGAIVPMSNPTVHLPGRWFRLKKRLCRLVEFGWWWMGKPLPVPGGM